MGGFMLPPGIPSVASATVAAVAANVPRESTSGIAASGIAPSGSRGALARLTLLHALLVLGIEPGDLFCTEQQFERQLGTARFASLHPAIEDLESARRASKFVQAHVASSDVSAEVSVRFTRHSHAASSAHANGGGRSTPANSRWMTRLGRSDVT